MDPTYQTLSMIRNLGKIRVPCENSEESQYKMLYEKLRLGSGS